jgi:hypothetical protein
MTEAYLKINEYKFEYKCFEQMKNHSIDILSHAEKKQYRNFLFS